MKILITGGAGFIGSCFVRLMLKSYPSYQIIVLDALTYAGHLENLECLSDNPNYRFVQGNICNVKLINELLANIDICINFAAESHVDRSITDAASFVQTNITGTQVLLDAARDHKIQKYIQVSTDEVYGSLGLTGYFTEQTPIAPNSPYSASKAAADLLVQAYHETYGLPTLITRCSNNYGPYQYPEKLIPLFINNLMNDKQVPVYGDGLNVRDWLYVEDHCRAIDAVMHHGRLGHVYNIGGNNEKTNLEITEILLKAMDKNQSSIEYVTDRLGHDRRYAIDSSKIQNELNWSPEVTFEEGIALTIEWYKNNQDWMQKVLSKK